MSTNENPENGDAAAGNFLDDWDARWELVPGGFRILHPELKGIVGLYRGVIDGQTMCLGCATEHPDRGLYKRLQNFLGPPQKSNRHGMAQMIIKHMDVLELEVLKVGSDTYDAELTIHLKTLMTERHKPVWDWARKAKI